MCSTGSLRSLSVVVITLLALLGTTPDARGDAFGDARKVFGEAQTLYGEGKYKEAAERYTTAYRLIRSPLILFNIAQARRLQFQRDGDYKSLVTAASQYRQFIKEADPKPSEKARAEENLREVEKVSTEEAKKRFGIAENAMRLGRYEEAIPNYEAAYELTKRPGILFNLAQAQRKQFTVDAKLDRLARAEDLVVTYRREAEGQVAPETIEQILSEIRAQRAEYHRKRDAEARAKEPPAMRQARERYQQGDSAGALKFLAKAEQTKGNPRVVLLQIYRLRGQAAALAGQTDVAVEAFKRYLAIEPAADGTGLQEAAMAAFESAKSFWKDKTPLKIEHLPPGKVPPQKPVNIPVKVASDPLKMVSRRELHYRRQGVKKWETIALTGSEPAARLPSTPLPLVGKKYRMEYYVLAQDRNQGVLDSLGNPNAPLGFLVTEDAIPPKPIYKRWWFWAGTGAVVAGTVATILIVRGDGLPDNASIGGDVSQ